MVGERILVLGNVNVDLVMGEVDGWPAVGTEVILPRSEMRPGGSAGNTALALSGLGIPHRLVAAVGADALGTWLAGSFDPACSHWIEMPCATTITVGIVHKGGDRAFFTTTGHLYEARLEDLLAAVPAIEKGMALVSGGFLMPNIEAGTSELLAALKAKGWSTAIDPGWPPAGWTAATVELTRRWLQSADFALLNAEEVKGLAGTERLESGIDALAALLGREQTLVIKNGAEGALALRGEERIAAAAPRVDVIDTVGAGDTFNAAFLASVVDGGDLGQALSAGVAAASAAISTFPRRYSM